MNWTRAMLKYNARQELSQSLWLSVLVCFVGGLLIGESSIYSAFSDFIEDGPLRDLEFNTFYHPFYNADYLSVLIGVMLVAIVISIVFGLFISIPVKVGMSSFFIRAAYGDRRFGNIFSAFGSGKYLSVIGAMVHTVFIIFLWTMAFFIPAVLLSYFIADSILIYTPVSFLLLFPLIIAGMIPGIIKMYQYYQVPYILCESPGMSGKEAMRISRAMTDYQKWSMFVLELSFLGWALLAALPSVIANIISVYTFGLTAGISLFIGTLATVFALHILQAYAEATYAQLYFAQKEAFMRRTMPPLYPPYYPQQNEPPYNT